ncbi:MAG: hypothetical protein AABY26_02585, partial [Nanoarchaeota archaeon]
FTLNTIEVNTMTAEHYTSNPTQPKPLYYKTRSDTKNAVLAGIAGVAGVITSVGSVYEYATNRMDGGMFTEALVISALCMGISSGYLGCWISIDKQFERASDAETKLAGLENKIKK